MERIKILGAGSIGNHLAHAARRQGWSVDLCDIDPAALERTAQEIYPGRYGEWDSGIGLFHTDDAPCGGYDLICIGTPPDLHISMALATLEERPAALLVEKPLCGPGLEALREFVDKANDVGVPVFVGYDHVVGAAAASVADLIGDDLGEVETIDVEFREHWGGIFAAHPWLDGPRDSYLGYWRRGGGACGEHSHAINLWQRFARLVGAGRVVEVSAMLDYVRDGTVDYDRLALLHFKTEGGLIGRVVQDVVTRPIRKFARIQARDGWIEWHCGYRPGCDAVVSHIGDSGLVEQIHEKTRPDDFIRELGHIRDCLDEGTADQSPIALQRGLETMLVVAAAHRSASTGRTIRIDYDLGPTPEALIEI
jgi:predicted dehydrogenase